MNIVEISTDVHLPANNSEENSLKRRKDEFQRVIFRYKFFSLLYCEMLEINSFENPVNN